MNALLSADAPFLVGGGFALERYTGIRRYSKDFDIFVRESDIHQVLGVLASFGCETHIAFPHWLGKACRDEGFLDVIYGAGNGVANVDELWFEHAVTADILGLDAPMVPAEEMMWSKAFIQERERYDGADIAHILNTRAESLDWDRLVWRFGTRWRVLLSHLITFGFIYPGERHRIPQSVMRDLLSRLNEELDVASDDRLLCQGTLLSREQYLPDLERGYEDARHQDDVRMTTGDITLWTLGSFIDGGLARR